VGVRGDGGEGVEDGVAVIVAETVAEFVEDQQDRLGDGERHALPSDAAPHSGRTSAWRR
jgi:hypothetical protein